MPELHITGKGMTDEETDELARAGHALGVFRQCSIGYHEECSDPEGERCKCVCHTEDEEPDYPPGYQGETL